jgi:hypothetical protein
LFLYTQHRITRVWRKPIRILLQVHTFRTTEGWCSGNTFGFCWVHTFRTTEGCCSGNAFGFRCKCTHYALQRAAVVETHSGFAVSAHIPHYRGLL